MLANHKGEGWGGKKRIAAKNCQPRVASEKEKKEEASE